MGHVGHPCGSSRRRSHLPPRLHPPSSILHSRPSPLPSDHSVILSKKSSPALAFKKPGAILIPLEVYMVNSPSRPDLQAPAPVECGGLTPLWHRETCLPVDRAAMSAPSPSSVPTCPNETRKPVTETRFSKQSNQIKPNQTKSNHPGPRSLSLRSSRFPLPWLLDLRNPRPGPDSPPQSRQNPLQSCLIKANQGKRRFFKQPYIRSTHPLDGADRQSKGRNMCQGSPSPRGRGPG